MKKRFGIAALIASTLVVTGCTGPIVPTPPVAPVVGPIAEAVAGSDAVHEYWKEAVETKNREDIAKTIARGPEVRVPNGRAEKCLQTLNVIGVGNPGTENLVVTSVFDSVKAQVLKDVKGLDPALVTLTIPTYEGDDMVTPRHLSLSDGSLDTVRSNAAKAVSKAVRDAQDNCAGSKTILVANGFGASVVREASSIMNPISQHSVSRMVIITDPNRSRDDAVDTLSVGESVISKLSGDADGKLNYSGLASKKAYAPELHEKILSVCHPLESICNNDPEIPMGFSANPEQKFVFNIAMYEDAYVLPQVTALIAEWVAQKTAADYEAAASSRDSYADLTEYLKYVNLNNKGAKVVQDTPAPASVETCEADYAIFTTRGSGENVDGNENSEYLERKDNTVGYKGGQPAQAGAPILQGLTRFPATLAWEIASKLPADKTIRFIPVQYHAVPIPGAPWQQGTSSIDQYLGSVGQGVTQLSEEITEFQKECPDTPIAMIGYSQGSQVAHTVLSQLPEESTANIKSVLLIADPLMNNGVENNGIEYDPNGYNPYPSGPGNFSRYLEHYKGISTVFGLNDKEMKEHVSTKVVQICDGHDPVCNFVGSFKSIDVHSSAYSHESHYIPPAKFAVEKLTGKDTLSPRERSSLEDQKGTFTPPPAA